jgi:hypothetical protein
VEFGRFLDTSVPVSSTYVFDFSGMAFIEPFAALFVSAQVRRFIESRKPARFQAIGVTANPYAGHIGFFRACGLSVGEPLAEGSTAGSYIPITVVSVPELREEARRSSVVVQEAIERRARDMARTLTQTDSGDIVDAIGYSLCEIMRNVVEHSEGPTLQYCAQYWPTKDRVDLAILDCGIGVRASLQRNPGLEMTSDADALNLSLMPGISGKAFRRKAGRSDDVWRNSGFGLYMTSRLCGNGGAFFICSGSAGLHLSNGAKKTLPLSHKGTALCLTLHTRKLTALSQALQTYAKEGDEIAATLSGASLVTASTASRVLREGLAK